MKRFNLYFWFVLLSPIIHTAVFAQGTPRKQINFDENWKFAYGNASDSAKDFNYGIATIFSKSGGAVGTAIAPKFNDRAWRSLQLPHDWAVELPFVNSPSETVAAHGYKPVGGLFPETSIGWYRKHFRVDRADSGQRFQIQFDGIFRDATVWINGLYAGNHKSGYADISYDITNYLNYGGDNVVVVRVDATQYEGWFYEGAGIYRHVWLNQYNKIHIADNGVFIHTQTGNGSAIVSIETTIENDSFAPASATLSAVITDRDGRIIGRTAEQPLTLNVNEQKSILQKVNIPRPRRQ